MDPARAMGTFLRTWRAEWARLSRAQLAAAVSAQCECRDGKRIAPAVVRKWEQGQPPQTTEELEALTLVMRRHGLSAAALERFRQAIFASCVARQYPGMFGQPGLAERDDVDQVAHLAFQQHWHAPNTADIVALTANVAELEEATREALGCQRNSSRGRKQQVALCTLRAILGEAHALDDRLGPAAAAYRANAQALRVWFGEHGLGWPLTPLAQRTLEAVVRSRIGGPDPVSCREQSPAEWALRLLALHGEAETRKEPRVSLQAFFYALGALREHRHPAHAACRTKALAVLAKAETLADEAAIEAARQPLFYSALAAGDLDEAERHLAAGEHLREGPVPYQCAWHEMVGALALRAVQLSEAQAAFGKGLQAAQSTGGLVHWEAGFRQWLRACERRKPDRR